MSEVQQEKKLDSSDGGAVSSDRSSSSPGSLAIKDEPSYTEAEEKAVLRKVDRVLLPGFTFLYLLSFLDRSNVGNAKLYGMLTDINASPESYNTSLALYFLGYVLFEIPAQIVLKKFNPKVWLPTLTIAWGITATLQGLVRSQPGFLAARFFLGVSEAGLFPGIVFVFSMYYKRNERHWRVAVFFGGAAVAGAFGGILAYGIGHMTNVGNQPRWAWIFYLEGLFTVLVGVSAYWWVPSYPHDAKFLNPREREILLHRLRANGGDSADEEPFTWQGVWEALKDHLVLAYGSLFHGFAFPLYSLSLFLPTIIGQLGYASWQAQLLTVPPYTAAALAILAVAYTSHKTKQRGLWIGISGIVAIIGYIVLLTTNTAGSRYTGAFIAVIGIYSANALLLSWPSENVSPQTKRATAGGFQIFWGDVGAISGVLVYRPALSGNFYRTPHIIAIAYTVVGILVAVYLTTWMRRQNIVRAKLREGGEAGHVFEDKLDATSGTRKGDRHPGYVYQI